MLAGYGPETRTFRDYLKNSVAARVQRVWGEFHREWRRLLHAVEKSASNPVIFAPKEKRTGLQMRETEFSLPGLPDHEATPRTAAGKFTINS